MTTLAGKFVRYLQAKKYDKADIDYRRLTQYLNEWQARAPQGWREDIDWPIGQIVEMPDRSIVQITSGPQRFRAWGNLARYRRWFAEYNARLHS